MDASTGRRKKAFAYYSGGKTWHLLLLKRRNADGPALPGAKPGHAEPERLPFAQGHPEGDAGHRRGKPRQTGKPHLYAPFFRGPGIGAFGESQCVFVNPAPRQRDPRGCGRRGRPCRRSPPGSIPKLLTGLAFHPLDE